MKMSAANFAKTSDVSFGNTVSDDLEVSFQI